MSFYFSITSISLRMVKWWFLWYILKNPKKIREFCCLLFCPLKLKLMAVGVSGVNGVFALNQWMAYKPGTETVSTWNQNMVVTPAMDPELLWGSVETHKRASKVSWSLYYTLFLGHLLQSLFILSWILHRKQPWLQGRGDFEYPYWKRQLYKFSQV